LVFIQLTNLTVASLLKDIVKLDIAISFCHFAKVNALPLSALLSISWSWLVGSIGSISLQMASANREIIEKALYFSNAA
jgi:hypothetical protein